MKLMAIFDNIFGMFGGILGQQAGAGFPKTLIVSDFISTSPAVTVSKWNTIGEYTIPAQQKYMFGYGEKGNPDNQGYIYVLLKNAAATELTGKIRLTYSDANKFLKQTIYEEQEAVLHGSTTDRRLMRALPRIATSLRPDGAVRQDDRLLIEFYPDSSDTVSTTTSTIYIPATQLTT